MNDRQYLDPRVLDELADAIGDRTMVRELLEMFLSDTGPLVNKIAERLVVRDYATIGRAAHRIKSGAAYVGATNFSAACGDLELVAREGLNARAIEEKVTAVRSSWEGTAASVQAFLTGGHGD